jgi:hypothetical protein
LATNNVFIQKTRRARTSEVLSGMASSDANRPKARAGTSAACTAARRRQ